MGNNVMCSCDHPVWDKSMDDYSKEKFRKSMSRNTEPKEKKSETEYQLSILQIEERRMELQSKLDKERQQFAIMKRAYDTIKTDTDTNINNDKTFRRLSQEKDQYQQQLLKDRQKSEQLQKEIEQYKKEMEKMQSQLTEINK
mmetsp:Transcript_63474/g.57174  ORF Transcript_63474/g.57174 Transcript_63474/m.57174 type:complete len:142 (+) Transcript_63474:20-445(+)|eukprot:CAMPEP_0201571228 /NCGR_PEP_ID=MMETSP0190_2-20130828/13901_1 /ASSEMBLY_ACC=CAM_ASM_000263 /TAXON_ID=37353 /ORGANISM="Rosalina sp." /LENGTH=141 /DNA_ID=CAMNT_0047995645 /DNA_START=20 /DNA_END=445 /DNA_ORIENTATION=+